MPSFDWTRFFNVHGVDYVTRGPNISRGHVGVRCPFCGPSDPSEHMSISLKGKGWRCWRNYNHKGKSRTRLIQALLKCSWERARELAGEDEPLSDGGEDWHKTLQGLMNDEPVETRPVGKLEFLPEFRPLGQGGLKQIFWDYMIDRGWTNRQVKWLAERYNLQYALRGRFSYRLIIPLYDENGALVNWTGRSVVPGGALRYRTLRSYSNDEEDEGPVGFRHPGELVLGLPWLHEVEPARALVVTEGPLDAMRISASGHKVGVYGTCLFGLQASAEQGRILGELADLFDRTYLLLDPEAEVHSLTIHHALSSDVPNLTSIRLPEGVEDPGALTAGQADEFIHDQILGGR